MNAAHFHLLTNHIPVIGIPFVTALLVIALILRQRVFERVSLGFLVVVALAIIPVYLSGERAEEIIEDLPAISHDRIEEHEERAELAFITLEVLGAIALLGLVLSRQSRDIPRLVWHSALAGTVLCLGLFTSTALLGGHIRHPEIRGEVSGIEMAPGDAAEDEQRP